jgi:hypothetical protein
MIACLDYLSFFLGVKSFYMPEKVKKSTWINIKNVLINQDNSELLNLIQDLYALNKNNKCFIEARYQTTNAPLALYKKRIDEALYPDVMSNKPVNFSAGRKAISEYKKSTQDVNGTIALMVLYVKTGSQFTLDYGDMYDEFYDSLISMFHSILKVLVKADDAIQNKYVSQLGEIVNSVKDIGWGYYDDISELLYDYFPDFERG